MDTLKGHPRPKAVRNSEKIRLNIYTNIESINIFCGNVVKKRTAEEACAYFWDHRDKTGLTDFEFLPIPCLH